MTQASFQQQHQGMKARRMPSCCPHVPPRPCLWVLCITSQRPPQGTECAQTRQWWRMLSCASPTGVFVLNELKGWLALAGKVCLGFWFTEGCVFVCQAPAQCNPPTQADRQHPFPLLQCLLMLCCCAVLPCLACWHQGPKSQLLAFRCLAPLRQRPLWLQPWP